MNTLFFDDINSYYDLNLILQPFEIPPAEPKTNYIDVPGADGDIDLTEALGEVKYKCRSASAVFSVLPSDDWEQKKSEVSNLLNGRKCKIRKSSDPDWYFEGRCTVKGYKCDKFMRTITVDMRLQPLKYAQEETVIEYNSSGAFYFNVRGLSVVPTITAESEVTLLVNGTNYNLSAGTHKYLDICLKPGENHIYKSGEHLVTFIFRERSL